jgi:hypothetical protein
MDILEYYDVDPVRRRLAFEISGLLRACCAPGQKARARHLQLPIVDDRMDPRIIT